MKLASRASLAAEGFPLLAHFGPHLCWRCLLFSVRCSESDGRVQGRSSAWGGQFLCSTAGPTAGTGEPPGVEQELSRR